MELFNLNIIVGSAPELGVEWAKITAKSNYWASNSTRTRIARSSGQIQLRVLNQL